MPENQKHTENQLYKTCTGVYAGTRQLAVKEQRGRKYVNFQGKQINIKEIPEKKNDDPVFDYVFNFGFRNSPNPELDRLARERIYGKPKPAQKTTATILVRLKTGEDQTFEIDKDTDFRQWLKNKNIDYKYFKY